MKNIFLAAIFTLTSTFALAGNNVALRVTSGTKTDANELAQLIRDDSCFRNVFAAIKKHEYEIQNSVQLDYLIKQAGPAEFHFNYTQSAGDDLELEVTLRLYHKDGGIYSKKKIVPMGKKHVSDLNQCEQAVKLGFGGAISFTLQDSNNPDTELGTIVRNNEIAANPAPGNTGSQN